ncbi:MAG TPA: class I SAM-dependent methyltransferase [Syntrophales bacterium]|nr:class I SAM-dependent methyltransferase [Syntrophales bacterium]
MEKRDFDKGAESYDLKPGRVKLAQDVVKAIIKEVKLTRDMDVLDFGCGTGLVTLQLQPFVRTITGVDSSHGMLDVLKAKIEEQKLTNVKTEFIDMEKGHVLKGSFHLIISSMTLHHVQDLGYLLRQFYNRLLSGGLLCIADLDSDGSEFHSDKTGVVHAGFERSDLHRLFNRCGFHDVRDVTAARVVKDLSDGRAREFTVFLMTGRK